MITIKTTSIRPNTSTPFFEPDSSILTLSSNMSDNITFNEDGLTQTVEIFFNSSEKFIAFDTDTTMCNFLHLRNVYNIENNIEMTTVIKLI